MVLYGALAGGGGTRTLSENIVKRVELKRYNDFAIFFEQFSGSPMTDFFASYAFKRQLIIFCRGNFLASKLGPPTFLVSSEALILGIIEDSRGQADMGLSGIQVTVNAEKSN